LRSMESVNPTLVAFPSVQRSFRSSAPVSYSAILVLSARVFAVCMSVPVALIERTVTELAAEFRELVDAAPCAFHFHFIFPKHGICMKSASALSSGPMLAIS